MRHFHVLISWMLPWEIPPQDSNRYSTFHCSTNDLSRFALSSQQPLIYHKYFPLYPSLHGPIAMTTEHFHWRELWRCWQARDCSLLECLRPKVTFTSRQRATSLITPHLKYTTQSYHRFRRVPIVSYLYQSFKSCTKRFILVPVV